MFQLRPIHLEAFRQASLAHFLRRAAQDLRERFPQAMGGQPEAVVREFVRESIERAAHFALESEYAVVRFAYLRVMLGAEFDVDLDYEPVQELLMDGSEDENERVDLALDYVFANPPPRETEA
jgi:hypothetical protein